MADQLKISKVTVSKALRNHPDISKKTKLRINQLATKLGYVPNLMARNLSAGRSKTIGVVVPKIAHHFFSTVIEAIYKTAYKNGYEIILTISQEDAEHEARHIQTLLSMRVDGLLISVTEKTSNKKIFKMVKSRNVPVVFFDRTIDGLGFNSVTTDDIQGAELATEFLIKSGHRKIAYFGGYSHTNIGQDRKTGFLRTMKKHGIPVKSEWLIESGFGEEDGYNAFDRLFKSKDLPEVIFAITYPVALGIYASALENNILIPKDIDLICFGGMGYQRFVTPSISYIKQNATEIGIQSAELLINELAGEPKRSVNIKVPTELIICNVNKNGQDRKSTNKDYQNSNTVIN